jgi:hypothetical protein
MITTNHNHVELAEILQQLPEEKVAELIDFAKFLLTRYVQKSNSQIDESALLLQQKALAKIWNDPEEDVYEL